MWELWADQQQQNKAKQAAKIAESTSRRELEKLVSQTIEQAEKSRPSIFGKSKAETVRGIRDNRQQERDAERQAQTKAAQPEKAKKQADVTYLHGKPDDGSFPDFLDDLFGDDE